LDHAIDDASRVPFIVMELLEGESLAAALRRQGRLPPSQVFTIATHLGRALSRAHQSGIVHRDLKPDNIFLVPNGDEVVTKVLDFGVARAVESQLDSSALTGEGRTVGTPFYMSPEQLRGKTLDFRLDLWSFATIVAECLTGKRPFHAANLPALAALLCGAEPRPAPSALGPVPLGFDAWFARATHSDISARFQSAQELVEQLRPICLASTDGPLLVSKASGHPLSRAAMEAPTASVEAPTMAALSRTQESVVPRLLRGKRPLVGLAAAIAIGAAATASVRTWRSSPAAEGISAGRADSTPLAVPMALAPAAEPPPAASAIQSAPHPVQQPTALEAELERPRAPPAAKTEEALLARELPRTPQRQRVRRSATAGRKKMEPPPKAADDEAVTANGRLIRGDL
jgi:serine/threonine-protein kinase